MVMRALYFPHIVVPDDQWFMQALLYWDEVATIVPGEYVDNPEQLGSYMLELLRSELLTQVIPEEHIHRVPRFTEAFTEFIESIQPTASPDGQKWFNIHLGKMGDIAKELCDRNLAIQARGPWCRVEPKVGMAFMTYLACVLGGMPELSLVPITNQSAAAFFPFAWGRHVFEDKVQRLRGLVLRQLLPIPDESVPLESIRMFKQDYGAELHRFRIEVECLVAMLMGEEDPFSRKYVLDTHTEKLKSQIKDISEAMERRNWRILFATIYTLGTAWSAIAEFSAPATLLSDVGISALLIGSVYSALQLVDSSKVRLHPMAYAASATRRFSRAGSYLSHRSLDERRFY